MSRAASASRSAIDVPWEKHRCFFEDRSSQRDAIERVQKTARELGSHPGVFAISVANEIPHDVVRFHGARRVEQFVDQLLDCARQEAPHCLLTYRSLFNGASRAASNGGYRSRFIFPATFANIRRGASFDATRMSLLLAPGTTISLPFISPS